MSRTLVIVTMLALLASSLVSCSRGESERADFVFVNRGEVNTLDPNRMSWLQDIRIGYAIYEGLYTLHPKTLQPIPGAASGHDLSEDQRTYTFHIRPEAKWSNGDPVRAEDFVFAWRRMLQTPGDYTYLLHYIRGAREYEQAFAADPASADFSMVGIRVPDSRTLVVELNNPTPFFTALCAFSPYWPLHEKSMEPFKRTDARGVTTWDASFTRPPHLVGNGPYVLKRWELKVGIWLQANDYYWNHAATRSRTIFAMSIEDPLLAFQKYEQGHIDWLSEVSADIAAQMRDAGRDDIHIFPAFGTYFYTVMCRPQLGGGRGPNPLADVRVRQALMMAIDKRPIVDNVTRLGEPITSNYVPAHFFPGYPKPQGLPYDVERARALLAEAGYPGGRGFPTLRISYNTEFAEHRMIAEIIRRQWQEKLGVNFELDGSEISQFREKLNKKDYDIARASWFGDYMDVSTFTDKYLSTSLNNDAAWVNERYDQLLRQAEQETDQQARLNLLSQAEQILLEEAPIMPLYHYMNKYAHRANVKGIEPNAKLFVMLNHVYVER